MTQSLNDSVAQWRKAFQASGKDVRDWSHGLQTQMSIAAEALESLREGAGVALDRFAQGMGTTIALSTVYSKSVEEAMERALKATAASIVSESVVQALRSLGLGFYLLAMRDFTGAADAFKSAAIWGALAGVAGAVGGAIPGGTAGATGTRATGGVAAGSVAAPYVSRALAPGAVGPAAPHRLTVMVMGPDDAAQWLANNVLNPYTSKGGTLVSSHTRRPPYAGR
jgi:hypothetical protein